MFIRYMSDLHLEFGVPKYLDPLVPMPEDRDSILVLAGDIGLGVEGIEGLAADLYSCNHRFITNVIARYSDEPSDNSSWDLDAPTTNPTSQLHNVGKDRGYKVVPSKSLISLDKWVDSPPTVRYTAAVGNHRR